jgi:hypothetical protein
MKKLRGADKEHVGGLKLVNRRYWIRGWTGWRWRYNSEQYRRVETSEEEVYCGMRGWKGAIRVRLWQKESWNLITGGIGWEIELELEREMERRWVDTGKQKVNWEQRWARKNIFVRNRKSTYFWGVPVRKSQIRKFVMSNPQIANPLTFLVSQSANCKSPNLQGKKSVSDPDPHRIFYTTKCQKSSLNLN